MSLRLPLKRASEKGNPAASAVQGGAGGVSRDQLGWADQQQKGYRARAHHTSIVAKDGYRTNGTATLGLSTQGGGRGLEVLNTLDGFAIHPATRACLQTPPISSVIYACGFFGAGGVASLQRSRQLLDWRGA